MENPFLVGKKLYLRKLEESDVTAEYVAWLNDSAVTRWLETGKYPSTLQSVRQFVSRFASGTTDLLFAIMDRKTGLHIGNVTLNHIHPIHRTADTGLLIGRKEFWGKGYASEAWSLLLEYAFDRLGIRKITAGAADGNKASIAVLSRLGFQLEGKARKQFFVDGGYQDHVRMGLFREELHRHGNRSGKAPAKGPARRGK